MGTLIAWICFWSSKTAMRVSWLRMVPWKETGLGDCDGDGASSKTRRRSDPDGDDADCDGDGDDDGDGGFFGVQPGFCVMIIMLMR